MLAATSLSLTKLTVGFRSGIPPSRPVYLLAAISWHCACTEMATRC